MKRFPSAIMATCCIPWSEKSEFAEEIFRRGIRASLAGTKHLYVFGTAGEGYAVTESQFDQIVRAFADEMRSHGAEPMVGIIHLAMGTILERIRRYRDQGVRLFQISLPSWGPLNEKELFRFFSGICGTFPDCQFMHYNLPRTKRIVTPREYGRLEAEHPNLVATKNSNDSLSTTADLLHHAPGLQHFLNEVGFLYGSLQGECSLLASFVTNWTRLKELFAAGKNRDLTACNLFRREILDYCGLLEFLGSDVHIDGAYDKMFAKALDREFPLRLLPPYSHVTDAQFDQFMGLLRDKLPQWLPTQDRGSSR